MSNYQGIDYGLGQSNINATTGIRYGVISQNSLNPDIINDVVSDGANYGTPHCPKCGNDAITIPSHTESDPTGQGKWVSVIQDIPEAYEDYETAQGACGDYACESCEYLFDSDQAFSEEMLGWSHESKGYKLTNCLDNDVFVLDSPYFTFAQFCSPCVPGAGNLDSPLVPEEMVSDAPRFYCLGHEWFEGNKAPYRVFKVSDNTEVIAESEAL